MNRISYESWPALLRKLKIGGNIFSMMKAMKSTFPSNATGIDFDFSVLKLVIARRRRTVMVSSQTTSGNVASCFHLPSLER